MRGRMKKAYLGVQVVAHFNGSHHVAILHLFLDLYTHLDIGFFYLLSSVRRQICGGLRGKGLRSGAIPFKDEII